MKRYKLFLLISLFLGINSLQAQMYHTEGRQICCGDSILNGSANALQVNPAFLGQSDRQRAALSFLQVGGNMYARGLDLSELFELSFTDNILSESQKEIILDKQNPSEHFRYNTHLDMTWLSFSVTKPGLGGLAVAVQDRMNSSATIPNAMIGMLVLGTQSRAYKDAESLNDLANQANGTLIRYNHLREVKVGYGNKLFEVGKWKVFGGITYRRMWGIGHFNGAVSEGVFKGNSSFSDFYRINYGQLRLNDAADRKRLLSSSGTGNAFDLGLSMEAGEKLLVSVAIANLGKLTWDQDLVASEANFASVADQLGNGLINSYNFGEEVGNLFNLVNATPGDPFTIQLNSFARVNASMRLKEKLRANAEIILPLRSETPNMMDYEAGSYTATLSWSPLPKLFHISSGLMYHERYGLRLPAGIMVGTRRSTMFSISTADLLTFLKKDDPFASLSIATLNIGI